MTVLHYIFDPLCGWCYAAAPLVAAAREVPGLTVQFHGGGMLAGANRRPITPEWRTYVMPHDRRIEDLTGQPFGTAYFDGLLRDTGAIMDSEPPTTAVLAADALADRGLDMIARLQRAHYVEGRRIADPGVLVELATELGLDAAAFQQAFTRLSGDATREHIAESRRLLAQVGGQGFPTFALERNSGQFDTLDMGRWLGQPAAWASHLAGLLKA
ncbi:DsbA family protein [Paraburkholderia sp.]|uniref:DsbA family protein n=1 Tax=Paraburkholderia sp. TaxID=1926495 RepID=UPI003C797782